MTPENVTHFINTDDIVHQTKLARVSHLRKLLHAMNAIAPDNVQIESMMKRLDAYKVKRSDEEKDSTTIHVALTADEVKSVFNVFGDNTGIHTRNRCMMAILFYLGLRRKELVSLKWSDIDLDEGFLTVRHGKGDKTRTIPILGGLDHMNEWFYRSIGREWVFCGFYKGDRIKADIPISTNTAWRVIKKVATALDIESLSTHDARRTLITNLLNSGASVADVQFMAGHSKPETTLGYAIVKNADIVKHRLNGMLKY